MLSTDHPSRVIATPLSAVLRGESEPAETTSATSAARGEPLPPTVAAIGALHFTGNLIPSSWYQHLKLPSGLTDLVGCTILGEIVYQYRPLAVRDEHTGAVHRYVKRFARDQFCAPLAYFERKFALTKDQVRQALKRLERAGLIRREYRTITVAGRLVHGMTFIEPVPTAIQAMTPHAADAPYQNPRPGAIQPLPDFVSPPAPRVTPADEAVSIPLPAVTMPVGAVPIPLYKDSSESPQETPTTPTLSTSPTVIPSPASAGGCSWDATQDKSSVLIPSPINQVAVPPPSITPPDTEKTLETPAALPTDHSAETTPAAEISETPPVVAIPETPNRSEPTDATDTSVTTPLLFDFHLAHLNDLEQAPFRKRLARLPAPLNQHVLDEYNSAVGRGTQFRNRWGWLEYLIRKAQAGEFIPTADLVERRRVQAVAAVIEPNSAGPVRVVSPIWPTHREALRIRLTAGDFGTYVVPLRGIEEGNRLWLEAPNPYIVDWVSAHWGLFEAVLNPHTSLQLGVRVEVA